MSVVEGGKRREEKREGRGSSGAKEMRSANDGHEHISYCLLLDLLLFLSLFFLSAFFRVCFRLTSQKYHQIMDTG